MVMVSRSTCCNWARNTDSTQDSKTMYIYFSFERDKEDYMLEVHAERNTSVNCMKYIEMRLKSGRVLVS